jgi:hypothetical protein
MDIWAWVGREQRLLRERGHARLAELVDAIPTWACNEQHARLDEAVPEALALARAAKSPWLELFIRHWDLQSRVLHRADVNGAIADAVSLLEFAHRPEAAACPQSICAVQDLTACYGYVDGPGYADERIAAADEALARIDANWACLTCIASEKAEALRDAGRPDDALAFIDATAASLVEAGHAYRRRFLARSKARVLYGLGRVEHALEECNAALTHPKALGTSGTTAAKITAARCLVRLGRRAEVDAAMPAPSEVFGVAEHYRDWVALQCERVDAGLRANDWRLERELHGLQRELTKKGVHRGAFELAIVRAKLALGRGRLGTASSALASAEASAGSLHRPLEAPAAIAQVREALAAAKVSGSDEAHVNEEDAEALRASLEDPDPELRLERLVAAQRAWPERAEVVLSMIDALVELGRFDEADVLLEANAAADTGPWPFVLRKLDALLERRDARAAEAFARRCLERATTEEAREVERFLFRSLARAAWLRQDAAGELEWLRRYCDVTPGDLGAKTLLGQRLRALGATREALEIAREVCAASERACDADWDRMLAGTMLGEWDDVRAAAARVGYALEGEGPIDGNFGVCKIRMSATPDDEGGYEELWAVRRSPVTARIRSTDSTRSIREAQGRQRYDDLIAFDALDLTPPPRDASEEARAAHVSTFVRVATLREGRYRTFALEGVHPGQEALDALGQALAPLGALIKRFGGEQYKVQSADGEKRLGLYAMLLVPADQPLPPVDAALTAFGAEASRVLGWPGLCEAIGDGARAAAQRAALVAVGVAPEDA